MFSNAVVKMQNLKCSSDSTETTCYLETFQPQQLVFGLFMWYALREELYSHCFCAWLNEQCASKHFACNRWFWDYCWMFSCSVSCSLLQVQHDVQLSSYFMVHSPLLTYILDCNYLKITKNLIATAKVSYMLHQNKNWGCMVHHWLCLE